MFVALEQGMDGPAQIADTLTMNDTDFVDRARAAHVDVFRDQFLDVFWIEVMEVENSVNRILDGVVGCIGHRDKLCIKALILKGEFDRSILSRELFPC